MTERDALYAAALLHDIGKFVERAKLQEWKDRAEAYLRSGEASGSYAHKRYSAAFIRHFLGSSPLLSPLVESLALLHHRGDEREKDDARAGRDLGVLVNLLRIADRAASSERKEDSELEPQKYHLARVQSPFTDIVMRPLPGSGGNAPRRLGRAFHLSAVPFGGEREAGFAVEESPACAPQESPYPAMVAEFTREFALAADVGALLALMEKYLYAVPAQTPVAFEGRERLSRPDINLYDHARVVAAIALCLHDEWTEGSWKGHDSAITDGGHGGLPEPCLLVSGDLSGIQAFIFDVVTDEKVARRLKGKSFYVQLLSEVVVRFLLDRLRLKEANVLFNGGGNFHILAPRCREEALAAARRELNAALLDDQLYVAIGWTRVGLGDFAAGDGVGGGITGKWEEARANAQVAKRRKFHELGVEVFRPFPQSLSSGGFEDLAGELGDADGYAVRKADRTDVRGWRKSIARLGYDVVFRRATEGEGGVAMNRTAFLPEYAGFRYVVKDLPRSRQGRVRTFEELADAAAQRTGTAKLGVLKMDVDNLGALFSGGLPAPLRTLSRVAVLSRHLNWFFEAYMNTLRSGGLTALAHPLSFRDDVYVVFSGGDDFLAVGAWDAVFEFARLVRREFSGFVCGHPGVTLSASLLVVENRFPVARFAPLADERLHEAKRMSPGKNAVSVFDQVLPWDDFEWAVGLKDTLVRLHAATGKRAVIMKAAAHAEELLSLAARVREGGVLAPKVWRLGYSLRDLIPRDPGEGAPGTVAPDVKGLVEEYERVAFRGGHGGLGSAAAFAVAARWAELASRVERKNTGHNGAKEPTP
jgi:CRISPR-associated protein Csm1